MIRLTPAVEAATAPLVSRYVGGDAWLAARLGGAPVEASLTAVARRVDAAPIDRGALVRAVQDTHRSLDPDAPTRANIDALADPATLAVVTGQQPGLLGGPLYTAFKAATAIALARRAEARLGRRVVPVFWVASDDHDLGEIEGCHVLTDRAEIRRHRVDLGATAVPSARLAVPADAPTTFEQILADVPAGSHLPAVRDMAAPIPGEPWPRWFSRILLRLFAGEGLVLIEPAASPGLLADLLRAEAGRPRFLPERLQAGAGVLASQGLDAPLPTDRSSALFTFDGTRRRRLDAAEAPAHATAAADLSPDAGLRAVLQSKVLPALAVVGGPGELAYWLQLTEAFDALEAPRPLFIPRFSGTVVEPRVRRALESLGLDPHALFAPAPAPQAAAAADLRERWEARLREAQAPLDALGDELQALGGALPARVADWRKAYRAGLDKLLDAAARQVEEGDRSVRRRIELIERSTRPLGKPQERVFGPIPYLVRAGLDPFAELARMLDPFDFRHQRIDLDGQP